MNLHGMVRGVVGAVNPDIAATWERSTGYTTTTDFKQAPSYAAPVTVRAQVQALSGGDVTRLEAAGVSMQAVMRKVYLYGNVSGIVRDDQQGGDLLHFPLVPGGSVKTWLVVNVLEAWPDWCSVAVALQVQ